MTWWQPCGIAGTDEGGFCFAREREVFLRQGRWPAAGKWDGPRAGEPVEMRTVHHRTVEDISCTGAVDSPVGTAEVIEEITASSQTERRAGRADDKMSEAALEDRKREGRSQPLHRCLPADRRDDRCPLTAGMAALVARTF